MIKLMLVVLYLLITVFIVGVLAPPLISDNSYDGFGAGAVLILLWFFGTALIVKRVFSKKESKA